MSALRVGQVLTGVTVGAPAHGGHFVCRHDGQVIFVRHAIPGEVVDVRITQARRKFARGDVVGISEASAHRIEPPCPIAGSCGGCDFQHVELAESRELKRLIVQELLAHQAGYDFTGAVEEVQPTPFGWRTRMRYHLASDGRAGLRAHRGSEVVALPAIGCLIAAESIRRPPADPGRPGAELLGVAASSGSAFSNPHDSSTVTEVAGGHQFKVARNGFWQAHSGAAELLLAEVLAALEPVAQEVALDLYCGVGLFASGLAAAGARVVGIEANRPAVALARRNVPHAEFVCGEVSRSLSRTPAEVDLVVLDPPRSGAGVAVVEAIVAKRPRLVGYVSCDPATLGRDLASFAEMGYRTRSVRAFDLFPLTHHIELLAVLEPANG